MKKGEIKYKSGKIALSLLLFTCSLLLVFAGCKNPFFPEKSKDGESKNYTVSIDIRGNASGDFVDISPKSGKEGAKITLNYNVAYVTHHNRLSFGGVNSARTSAGAFVPYAGRGAWTYIIDPADASDDRKITITATFSHLSDNELSVSFVNAGEQIDALTPLDPLELTVVVSGFNSSTEAEGVGLEITPAAGLKFAGHLAADGVFFGFDKTFIISVGFGNADLTANNNSETITISGITGMPSGYFCNSNAALDIIIIDGLDPVNPIPVKKSNIRIFNHLLTEEDTRVPLLNRHYKLVEDIVSIDIPCSVTTIHRYAFSNCVNLERVNLPESIVKIDESVFNGCRSLRNVIIPQGVTKINANTHLKILFKPFSPFFISEIPD